MLIKDIYIAYGLILGLHTNKINICLIIVVLRDGTSTQAQNHKLKFTTLMFDPYEIKSQQVHQVENHLDKLGQSLYSQEGPMTRSETKKVQEALVGII